MSKKEKTRLTLCEFLPAGFQEYRQLSKSLGQTDHASGTGNFRTLKWTLGKNHLPSSTSPFAAQKSRCREWRDYRLGNYLKILSSSGALQGSQALGGGEGHGEQGGSTRSLSPSQIGLVTLVLAFYTFSPACVLAVEQAFQWFLPFLPSTPSDCCRSCGEGAEEGVKQQL